MDELERMRERIVDPVKMARPMKKFKLKKRHVRIVKSNLYHMMQQYTKGSTAERITGATVDMAMDSDRALYFEGMQVSEHALFLAKGRVWRVHEAKRADFAAAVDS